MESLYLLIPLSVVLVAAAAGLFFWAVNSGQYDDVEREGDRILFDDEEDIPTAPRQDTVEKRAEENGDD